MEKEALQQLRNVASLPIVHSHVAAMPDVHFGIGATVGSVIPTRNAIIPAAVGVDIGCGMVAVRTSLRADQLPDDLKALRSAIERAVPHGRTDNGGVNDVGGWGEVPATSSAAWAGLEPSFRKIVDRHPKAGSFNTARHLGTLGTGNHFIEVCLDEDDFVWVMLHSGSRGVGNRIGKHFIQLARKDMGTLVRNLPDVDLANVSGIELYDQADTLLASAFAPLNGGGLSFVGITLDPGQQAARVRVISGNLALGAAALDTVSQDVVAMDDFIYSEPTAFTAVPEPGEYAAFGAVAEGLDVLGAIGEAAVDSGGVPLQNIRIKHTLVLADPFLESENDADADDETALAPDADGGWLLMEAELIEPDFYLASAPEGGKRFAEAVKGRL
jgi:hypothetical protein